MAVRTAALETAKKEGIVQAYPMIASETIYKNTPVMIKSSGRLAFSADGVTNSLANGDRFVGISQETVVNSGAASAEYVKVERQGSFLLKFSNTLTQGNVDDLVYANNTSGDDVVTVTSATGAPQVTIGKIVEFVSANYAYVAIDNYVNGTAANGA